MHVLWTRLRNMLITIRLKPLIMIPDEKWAIKLRADVCLRDVPRDTPVSRQLRLIPHWCNASVTTNRKQNAWRHKACLTHRRSSRSDSSLCFSRRIHRSVTDLCVRFYLTIFGEQMCTLFFVSKLTNDISCRTFSWPQSLSCRRSKFILVKTATCVLLSLLSCQHREGISFPNWK